MPKLRNDLSRVLMRNICYAALFCALMSNLADGQSGPDPKAEIQIKSSDPVEALKHDSDGSQDGETALGYDMERAVGAHAVQAIPLLEQLFQQRQNDVDKDPAAEDTSNLSDREKYQLSERHFGFNDEAHIASALIRLGVKDEQYWSYLEEQVMLVLNSDPPFPIETDADGKARAGPSPKFLAWANSHNLDPKLAAEDSMYIYPSKVAFLAETGDPRGIPLLRQALSSSNYLFKAFAAKGLAKLQDKDSIPLIIETCKAAPPDAARVVAESLVYFNDPEAQDAAEKYIPPPVLKALREKIRSYGNDPFR